METRSLQVIVTPNIDSYTWINSHISASIVGFHYVVFNP